MAGGVVVALSVELETMAGGSVVVALSVGLETNGRRVRSKRRVNQQDVL